MVKNKVAESTGDAILQAGGKLDLKLAQYEKMAMQFTIDKGLSELLGKLATEQDNYLHSPDMKSVNDKLKVLLGSDYHVQSIHLFLPNGETYSSSGAFEGDPRESDWFKRAVERGGKPYWIPTSANGLTGFGESFGLSQLLVDPTTMKQLGCAT